MRKIRAVIAAGTAAAVAGGTWLLLGLDPGAPTYGGSAVPAPAATSTDRVPSTSRLDVPPVPARVAPTGPPPSTQHLASAYLRRYDATRLDWDDVLARGHALPRVDQRCAARWRDSGLDPRIDRRRSRYWCLDGLPGRSYKPQGIAGSGTTEGYRIRGRSAGARNLVLTSWYSRESEQGLFARNGTGDSVTRLVVIDLDRRRYGTVELVRPDGAGGLERLNSHGSGLAWTGQYLYSSSRSWVWLFNADDLLDIDGHIVLPAVARWSVSGSGGASSISLERRWGLDRLTAINYARNGTTRVQSFDLDRRGLLVTARQPAPEPLLLTTGFGERRRVIRSAASLTVPGRNYQGIGTWRRYQLANSSSLRFADGGGPGGDATVVLRDGTVVDQYALPGGNVESVYVDPRRRTYASLTEGGSRFLFVLPLSELVGRAAR